MCLHFTGKPIDHIHINFLTIESSKTHKEINVLVITDYFTCFGEAKAMAHTLWYTFLKYGFPEKIFKSSGL